MTNSKWIIWSFDAEQDQTFADIVVAKDVDGARRKVAAQRPYATLDLYARGELLETYIANLQTAAAKSNREIENEWKKN